MVQETMGRKKNLDPEHITRNRERHDRGKQGESAEEYKICILGFSF